MSSAPDHCFHGELTVSLDQDSSQELVDAVIKRLQFSGLLVRVAQGLCTETPFGVLIVSADRKEMEKEAELREMQKLMDAVDPLSKRHRHEIFLCQNGSKFANYESDNFFLPFERAMLVQSLLESTTLGKELGGMLESHADSFLIGALRRTGKLEAVVLLHDQEEQLKLWKAVQWSVLVPVQQIRDYFGSEVAFYFAWLNFFTIWLMAPGVFGFCLWYFREVGVSVDNSSRIPAFTVFVTLWSITFLTFWGRQAAAWACTWDTLDCDDSLKTEDVRLEFHGNTRISPVSGKKELHYPSWMRWYIWYPLSACVTLFMLSVAFGFMCLSLNLQGYVHGSNEFDLEGRRHFESPIHVEMFSQFAHPGALFDPNVGYVMPMIPVMIHVVVIMILNMIYGSVAEWLTGKENHKTVHDHQNSLVLKRFIFEAFDAYIGLFYIAFYEADVIKLRGELVAVYTADSARRLIVEVMIPRLAKLWSSNKADKLRAAQHKKQDDFDPCLTAVEEALSLGEYEAFDDYLEMVIEFGYVVLFASAFPLAAILSVGCNLIEMRSDLYKLCFVCQRPPCKKANNIGIWKPVLTVMAWLAVLTNTFIMGIASEQLEVWFPSMFKEVDGPGAYDHRAKKSGLMLMFGIEHVLLLLSLAITFVVRPAPSWVKVDLDRREYEARQALARERMQTRDPSLKTTKCE